MQYKALYNKKKNEGLTTEQAAEAVVAAIGEALSKTWNDAQRRALRKEANAWLDMYQTAQAGHGISTTIEYKIRM